MNVGLQRCRITEVRCMGTAPHQMVGLERMSDYRDVRLEMVHGTVEPV